MWQDVFSLAINASLALCIIASELLLKILPIASHARAGALLLIDDGNLEFLPVVNWYGGKPYTLFKKFFTFMHHATAISGKHWVSSRILSSILERNKLCFSTRLLLQDDSAAMVFTVIPSASHNFNKFAFSKFNFIDIQELQMISMM